MLTLVGMIFAPILLVAVGAGLMVALTPRPVPVPPAPPAPSPTPQVQTFTPPASMEYRPTRLPDYAPTVRRAELVPVTVKRATLLRLPTQELGVYKSYDLPAAWGGGSVWARYMGTKGRFSEIPPNAVPGDLWNITETPVIIAPTCRAHPMVGCDGVSTNFRKL
jgi:hypothetical protein